MTPRAARLQVELVIGFRNGGGIEHGVLAALGDAVAGALAFDLAVDHDVRDVDTLRLELARHALRECAQTELADRKIVKLRAATQ